MRAPMKCYFFRQGVQLKGHAYNGADLLGLGEPSGIAGKLFCIESIDVARGPHDATGPPCRKGRRKFRSIRNLGLARRRGKCC